MNFFAILAIILISAGIFFFLGAAIGVIRFPDFYTRMHAAGKGDTLSSLLVLLGFAVYQLKDFHSISHDWVILLVILKLMAISTFILLTSPTSTHALMNAGWEDGIEPKLKEGDDTNHLEEDRGKPENREL